MSVSRSGAEQVNHVCQRREDAVRSGTALHVAERLFDAGPGKSVSQLFPPTVRNLPGVK